MSTRQSNHETGTIDPKIGSEAAAWVVRRDRGLTVREQREYDAWLKAHPRNAQALARSARVWSLLDPVPAAAPKLTPVPSSLRSWSLAGLVVAAALVIGVIQWQGAVPAPVPAITSAGPRTVTLSDGTVVTLNAGSEAIERFTAAERRVELVRGQAHFVVSKNPARPFVVSAGPVEVQAVGTAFDVSMQQESVEVLVTEGIVRVSPEVLSDEDPLSIATLPCVVAGQKAKVDLTDGRADHVRVSVINAEEQGKILAWMSPYLKLNGATLSELAAEFQRRTGHRLVIEDATLLEMRIGGRFRADDFDGFVRVLVENYGLETEKREPDTTVLRRRR